MNLSPNYTLSAQGIHITFTSVQHRDEEHEEGDFGILRDLHRRGTFGIAVDIGFC